MRLLITPAFLSLLLWSALMSSLNLGATAWLIPELGAHVAPLSMASGITSLWAWSAPSWDDIWEMVENAQEKGLEFADTTLNGAKEKYSDVGTKLDDFKSKLGEAVDQARQAKDSLSVHGVDIQEVVERLSRAGAQTVESLQNEFEKPLPEDLDERAAYRAKMVSRALDQLAGSYVTICTELGVPEEDARDSFTRLRRAVEDALLIAGKIIDNHPKLVTAIVITGVCFIMPEAAILRPIMSVFGFGPTGPIKGSLAAWMQRRFWGGLVEKGSWFAYLQSAGMASGWWSRLSSVLKAIGVLFGRGL
ncbi:hypothetical protein DFP72DRAFT_883591 [Ephemerocybe angulata]|uniref:Uncharacterized protein n=1 Tax=Ephemerocybe angulata TaxID=980116 RepID=A0A8H6IAE4_9AGAR|nr:hypothetical protein DFP72DRAFT_883591 [Tulosesus angulatus]